MKKIITIILLGMYLFVGCENIYRDELAQIHKEIDDISARLDAFCNETNTNIAALQTMIAALQAKDYVTGVVPVIENGRTLVPMRAIFEALNAEVTWDEATQTASAHKMTAFKEDIIVKIQIGSASGSAARTLWRMAQRYVRRKDRSRSSFHLSLRHHRLRGQ